MRSMTVSREKDSFSPTNYPNPISMKYSLSISLLHFSNIGLLTMVPTPSATGSNLWLQLEFVMDKVVKYKT